MQRRDARTFLEEVLKGVEGLTADTRDKLLAVVADKPGTKRAAKLASVLVTAVAVDGSAAGRTSRTPDVDGSAADEEPRRG
jgi:hypothetical protein